jgi:histidine ammonia-lyase
MSRDLSRSPLRSLLIGENRSALEDIRNYVFRRESFSEIEIGDGAKNRVTKSQSHLYELLEKRIPIYGVTTGFGDSCFRVIPPEKSEELQHNLIAYLSCGTGPKIPELASRATTLIRLKSFCRGYSGVSLELVERMKLFLERGWTPVVPREGSLGASGDLIPLAYLARALMGEGMLEIEGKTVSSKEAHAEAGLTPYRLKPKEGLALVNGTSAMAGLCLVNLSHATFLTELATLSSSWLCLALRGKLEAFSVLVNEKAKNHPGQATVAQRIRSVLADENYAPKRGQDVSVGASKQTEEFIQDRYSLRCSPQILGPVIETIKLCEGWLETEINSTSDNPLIDDDGSLWMGGNFYGGYLGHGMDYLKISLAHTADLIDRQLTFLIDEKSNRGLTPNLADWDSLPEEDRFLHHGLKGLHQAVNAITSEILARATPNTIFSRSSESHNQDKVSLGMSAAVQCSEMIEPLYTIQAMHLTCLAQALDLRGIRLQGELSRTVYNWVRDVIPRTSRDTSLGDQIGTLAEKLKQLAIQRGRIFDSNEKA